MIDDFEAVLLSDDAPIDDDERVPPRRESDNDDGWRYDFRSYLDDPE